VKGTQSNNNNVKAKANKQASSGTVPANLQLSQDQTGAAKKAEKSNRKTGAPQQGRRLF